MIALATRGSALARAQTGLAMAALRARFPELEFTEVVLDSDGDLSPAELAPDLPGQGWFTSRLERALSTGQVEGAIHSAKDLPTDLSPELMIAGFLPRADPRDALVSAGDLALADLAPGARVGTSSPRRSAQLLALRPDLEVVAIRGNVDTRVRKVRAREVDGCVVALAGLLRIGRESDGQPLDPGHECTPAPAQGAIAIQARVGSEFAEMARAVDDPVTRSCVEAERSVLTEMGGGCRLPLGALAEPVGAEAIRLTVAWVGEPGGPVRRITELSSRGELAQLAIKVAGELR
ncbi:MAG TPA: hydroxymethylbilane synthase [Candidatus Dormibacteraeota bacterium]|nr:hydroxymethylbilane synthase [Candidatus Dormibacteraeota bacterium]